MDGEAGRHPIQQHVGHIVAQVRLTQQRSLPPSATLAPAFELQQRAGFVGVHSQGLGSKLDHPALGPQPRHWQ